MLKVLFHGYLPQGNVPYGQIGFSFFETTTGEFTEHVVDPFDSTGAGGPQDFMDRAKARIVQYASDTSRTISASDISEDWAPLIASKVPAGMVNAPRPAVTDAPADAVTNYNVVTTLLGGVTGAVNTANTKQNDIATKLNSVLAALRSVGIIVT